MNGARMAAKVWDALTRDGGPGSGDFGHDGRPGEIGGSGQGGSEQTIPVFHGTRKEFDAFKPKYVNRNQLGFGIHFTREKSFAAQYAEGKGGHLVSAVLHVHSVLDADRIVLEGSKEYDLAKQLAGKKFYSDFMQEGRTGPRGTYLQNAIDATSPQRAEKLIRDAGYDCIRYTSKMVGAASNGYQSQGAKATSYVVFDPEKIEIVDKHAKVTDARKRDMMLSRLKGNV